MSEKVRIHDVSVTDDGLYRLTLFTDNGITTIELDRENALKFACELFIASLPDLPRPKYQGGQQ